MIQRESLRIVRPRKGETLLAFAPGEARPGEIAAVPPEAAEPGAALSPQPVNRQTVSRMVSKSDAIFFIVISSIWFYVVGDTHP